ncbi:unnamed protein product [Cyprideis torosa]|uniref:Uncharacterized protein n=1 Tax=Cyprideis torosa TaxID=163714 RepID=A0A7R8WAQ5_9CRUS|nr:unnamed protein product [Cyprideis torosa]CAG0891276.1 unnamed protein product [Cyprideis torosa]
MKDTDVPSVPSPNAEGDASPQFGPPGPEEIYLVEVDFIPRVNCPANYVPVGESCYSFQLGNEIWDEARESNGMIRSDSPLTSMDSSANMRRSDRTMDGQRNSSVVAVDLQNK